LLASDADTVLVHPLLDPTFLAALARTGGRLGFGDRTAGMRAVFHDVLPDDVLCRATKAEYGEAFWGSGTREFAARWSGPGVDQQLVDPTALRREWLKPRPHEDSAMLLHAAWLAEQD
jgi:asparagine synthase (glutamine-hydrolysing)